MTVCECVLRAATFKATLRPLVLVFSAMLAELLLPITWKKIVIPARQGLSVTLLGVRFVLSVLQASLALKKRLLATHVLLGNRVADEVHPAPIVLLGPSGLQEARQFAQIVWVTPTALWAPQNAYCAISFSIIHSPESVSHALREQIALTTGLPPKKHWNC